MGLFEEGNELWKVRSTHGRDAIMTSSGKLWDAAVEYFEWCTESPMVVTDFKGKDATPCKIKTVAPFTIREFAVFVGASRSWWRNFKMSETVKNDPGFLTVIERIEDIMYTQKFRGASIGYYKENLISRELGLKDNQAVDITSGGEKLTPQVIKWGTKEIKVWTLSHLRNTYLYYSAGLWVVVKRSGGYLPCLSCANCSQKVDGVLSVRI
jgi:hypothetical protein